MLTVVLCTGMVMSLALVPFVCTILWPGGTILSSTPHPEAVMGGSCRGNCALLAQYQGPLSQYAGHSILPQNRRLCIGHVTVATVLGVSLFPSSFLLRWVTGFQALVT